jgi:hypothetical protein
MRPAADPANTSPNPQYQSPDQAYHELTGALHDPDLGIAPGQPVAFTTDGTYLRLQNASQTLEHPDGTRRTFGSQARPTRIEDPFRQGWQAERLSGSAKPRGRLAKLPQRGVTDRTGRPARGLCDPSSHALHGAGGTRTLGADSCP